MICQSAAIKRIPERLSGAGLHAVVLILTRLTASQNPPKTRPVLFERTEQVIHVGPANLPGKRRLRVCGIRIKQESD